MLATLISKSSHMIFLTKYFTHAILCCKYETKTINASQFLRRNQYEDGIYCEENDKINHYKRLQVICCEYITKIMKKY